MSGRGRGGRGGRGNGFPGVPVAADYDESNLPYENFHDPHDASFPLVQVTKPIDDKILKFTSDFTTFNLHITTHLSQFHFKGLNNILTGIEKYPIPVVHETEPASLP